MAEEFSRSVVEKAKKLKSGDPMDPATDVGTVIHEGAAKTFERRVDRRGRERAPCCCTATSAPGRCYAPTVVDKVPYDCELVHEETFGPVIPIIRCPERHRRGDPHLELDRLWTFIGRLHQSKLEYITRFINELEVGTVNIWEVPGYRIEMSPFGGIKDSGLGYKEGVVEAMKSFTNVKTYSLPWPA